VHGALAQVVHDKAKASKQAQVLKFTLSPERRLQLALHSSHFIPMNQNDLRAQKKRSMVP
jgi:hypothetical protein